MLEQKHKHLDITIDFETCGLGANAAPMQLAAVAWNRFVPLPEDEAFDRPEWDFDTPFAPFGEEDKQFNIGIDLRSCFMLGLDFDKHTSDWWQQQSAEARNAVLSLEPWPLSIALDKFIQWVKSVTAGCTSYTIWAQGADFDIAKLNHYLAICGIKAPWKHTQVRCARTYILEHAQMLAPELSANDAQRNPSVVYARIPKMDRTVRGAKHDAFFDCYQTSWNVWYCFQTEQTLVTLTR